MQIADILLLLLAGLAAGFINTVAGGGSLLTLPVLIFMGLPPNVANATNRVAIFSQNAFATSGFISKGIKVFPYNVFLGISALLGALIGAKIAVDISGALFNRILGAVMVLAIIATIFSPSKKGGQHVERLTKKYQWIGIVVFFFIGIYGGFIQAGVGFIIIASLTFINRLSLVKTNSIKVTVVLIYTIAALSVFILEDKVNWTYGLVLAAGTSTGGWIASLWSVKKGDKWIRWVLIIAVVAMAMKLWFPELFSAR